MLSGDAEFQAVGDAMGALDEVLGRGRRTDLVRGVLEQREPAVEVAPIDRQRQILLHRPAMIEAAHQRNGRPERAHALQMQFPVGDARVEHGSEQRILTDFPIEGVYHALDHRFVDACPLGDLGGDGGAALGGSHANSSQQVFYIHVLALDAASARPENGRIRRTASRGHGAESSVKSGKIARHGILVSPSNFVSQCAIDPSSYVSFQSTYPEAARLLNLRSVNYDRANATEAPP